ncbi:MAG: hypothetical protein AAF196_10470 [Planctomycetota bacterium]
MIPTLRPFTRPPTRSLLSITLAATCLVGGAGAQDFDKDVRVAIDHKRLAVRRAAATKLAQAGDAATAAVRAAIEDRGRDAMPLALIDTLARANTPADGPLADLLSELAADQEFYWRAQSLDGLAARSRTASLPQFRRAVQDPSHLMRVAGARGLLNTGDGATDRQRVLDLLTDEDPRVPPRIGILLLEQGDRSGAEAVLKGLLGFERRFLDDPWGAREAQRAEKALRRIFGERFDALFLTEAEQLEDTEAREAANAAAARLTAHLGLERRALETTIQANESASDPTARTVGGLDIRSCRNGDLFLSWTDAGEIFVGLDFREQTAAPDSFDEVSAALRGLGDRAVHGRVVCDFLRVREGETDRKAAPGAIPEELQTWLKRLAVELETTDRDGLSAALRSRLVQFDPGD